MAIVNYNGTGRRKTSTARVYITQGKGKVVINNKEYKDPTTYFDNSLWGAHAFEPLKVVNLYGNFDVMVRVHGGGKSGQSGAVRLGLSRALLRFDNSLRPVLKENGMLTRDQRMVERKKYGLKKRENFG